MRVLCGYFLFILSITALLAQDHGDSPIRVVHPGSGWSLGSHPLVRGQTLSPLAGITGSASESVDLLLDCGKVGWLSYSCTSHPCHVPVCSTSVNGAKVQRFDLAHNSKLPASKSGDSTFFSLLRREPVALAVLGVREGGNPNDAVVRITGTSVHLAPALNRVLEGHYCFRFTPLPAAGATPQIFTMDWDRSLDSEGVMEAPALQAGLYAVEKSDAPGGASCNFESDAPKVWVLVASETDFLRIQPEWKSDAAQLHELELAGASPTILQTIRHAILANLADASATH